MRGRCQGSRRYVETKRYLWPQLQHLAKLHVKLLVSECRVREGRDFCIKGWLVEVERRQSSRPTFSGAFAGQGVSLARTSDNR